MNREGYEINEAEWSQFALFAEEQGVSTEDEQDWGPWWDCWKNGQESTPDAQRTEKIETLLRIAINCIHHDPRCPAVFHPTCFSICICSVRVVMEGAVKLGVWK